MVSQRQRGELRTISGRFNPWRVRVALFEVFQYFIVWVVNSDRWQWDTSKIRAVSKVGTVQPIEQENRIVRLSVTLGWILLRKTINRMEDDPLYTLSFAS